MYLLIFKFINLGAWWATSVRAEGILSYSVGDFLVARTAEVGEVGGRALLGCSGSSIDSFHTLSERSRLSANRMSICDIIVEGQLIPSTILRHAKAYVLAKSEKSQKKLPQEAEHLIAIGSHHKSTSHQPS